MPNVNANFCVSIHLVAQYGNFRISTTDMGHKIKVPAKHELHVMQIPPAIITIKDLDYGYFLDRVDDIADSLYFSNEYQELKRCVDMIDTTKIKIPESIPVSDVPLNYTAKDGLQYVVKGNTMIPRNGEEDLFTALLSDVEDDDLNDADDEEDDEDSEGLPSIESMCAYALPEFKFQSMTWKTYIDIKDFEFVKSKHTTVPFGTDKSKARPILDVIKGFFTR